MATQPVNSMSAPWCAARVAEARVWRDANSQQTPGWQHVHELLSQLDAPPAPIVAPEAQGLGAGRHPYHLASQVPEEYRADVLFSDLTQLERCVNEIQKGRHTMHVPAQVDDYDLLLTRIARLAPLILNQQADRLATLEAAGTAGAVEAQGLPAEVWSGAKELMEDAAHWLAVPASSNSDRYAVGNLIQDLQLVAKELGRIGDKQTATPVAPAPQQQGRGQVPGMPEAKCQGCGLPSHVKRCGNADCPMKGGADG